MTEERAWLPSARRPKPGRPRKHPENGHTPGTAALQMVEKKAPDTSALAWQAIAHVLPRLLNLDAAAQFLGVSTWTIRALVDNGTLKPVRIPMPNGKSLRKLTFDRLDLDAVVSEWKRVSA